MQALIKTALVAALSLSAFGAFAGEISDSTVYGAEAKNETGSAGAQAYQYIGSTYGSGKITNNSHIWARGAHNGAFSINGVASQEIGVAGKGGTMSNVTVFADRADNGAMGRGATATQEIGKVSNGTMKNVTVWATDARNIAATDGSVAKQKIGVVN